MIAHMIEAIEAASATLKYLVIELRAGEMSVIPAVPQPMVTTSSQVATLRGTRGFANVDFVNKW